ncbi:MAG: HEAT repeat domain-containing protein [Chloroflexota bacterium]|nr:HEAT repeat domain-containing protein [Chloroflexota bacterium]
MVSKRRVDEADREALIAAAPQAESPILEELAQLGFQLKSLSDLYSKLRSDIVKTNDNVLQVKSVDELYRKSIDYRVAIPTLTKWLPLVDNRAVKIALVRALSIKWARPAAARPLIEEFRKAPDEDVDLKWTIANALSEVADASVFDDIVELVRDKRHGVARVMLPLALAKTKDPRAVDVLMELLDDELAFGQAVRALRLLAPPEARGALERFVDHPKTWVRNEARRALAKIDKKLARAGKK